MSGRSQPTLEINRLSISRKARSCDDAIIDQVSLCIHPGETLALIGESGSGKSLTASAILGLLPESIEAKSGTIHYEGVDLISLPKKERRKLAGARIGYVFQDYRGSFSPFRTIGKQMAEALRTHRRYSHREAKQLVLHLLQEVELPAERVFDSYSFQLSGGQLQRAAMACAMMLKPSLLVADEPTTALDLLTGESVLDLMQRLQQQTNCAILFISHDLSLVWRRADRIAVMKDGRIVESFSTGTIERHALHPYTRNLLNVIPCL